MPGGLEHLLHTITNTMVSANPSYPMQNSEAPKPPLPSEILANKLLKRELYLAWLAQPSPEDPNFQAFWTRFRRRMVWLLGLMSRCIVPGLSPIALAAAEEYDNARETGSVPSIEAISARTNSLIENGDTSVRGYSVLLFDENDDDKIVPWWATYGERILFALWWRWIQ